MIYYVVTAKHSYTMESYLQTWGQSLNHRIELVFYEELPNIRRLPHGVYIFSDLERLSRPQQVFAGHVWEQLANRPGIRLLNHPLRTIRRYELLSTLFNLGANSFRVLRASDLPTQYRFPVFIRDEGEHGGSLTALLYSAREVSDALDRLLKKGRIPQQLLIAEFCDTADASGVYRKYSVFMIAGKIIPRHLIFSRKWVLKTADLGTAEMLREEREYMEKNPDESWTRKVFALANVDYGRIDYSFLDGKPQVWEINTNPAVLMRPKDYAGIHQPGQAHFARLVQPVFEELGQIAAIGETIELSIPQELVQAVPRERWSNPPRRLVKNVKNKFFAVPRVGVLTRHSAVPHVSHGAGLKQQKSA